MKKYIRLGLAIVLVLVLASVSFAATELNFGWKQDTMVAGDSWELATATTSGGERTVLVEIPYSFGQTNFEYEVSVEVPANGYYFAIRKIRGSDSQASEWSNEVFYGPVAAPYELKLIIKTE